MPTGYEVSMYHHIEILAQNSRKITEALETIARAFDNEPPLPVDASWAAEAIGERVKQLRLANRASQGHLAAAMAEQGFPWHQTTVYKVENGTRELKLVEAMALVKILGTTLSRFVDEETP